MDLPGEVQCGQFTFTISDFINSRGLIKRPMNAFMLYAKDERPLIQQARPGTAIAEISKVLGEKWLFLPPSEKAVYVDRARELDKLHRRLFPSYKYKPNKTKEEKREKSLPNAVIMQQVEAASRIRKAARILQQHQQYRQQRQQQQQQRQQQQPQQHQQYQQQQCQQQQQQQHQQQQPQQQPQHQQQQSQQQPQQHQQYQKQQCQRQQQQNHQQQQTPQQQRQQHQKQRQQPQQHQQYRQQWQQEQKQRQQQQQQSQQQKQPQQQQQLLQQQQQIPKQLQQQLKQITIQLQRLPREQQQQQQKQQQQRQQMQQQKLQCKQPQSQQQQQKEKLQQWQLQKQQKQHKKLYKHRQQVKPPTALTDKKLVSLLKNSYMQRYTKILPKLGVEHQTVNSTPCTSALVISTKPNVGSSDFAPSSSEQSSTTKVSANSIIREVKASKSDGDADPDTSSSGVFHDRDDSGDVYGNMEVAQMWINYLESLEPDEMTADDEQ